MTRSSTRLRPLSIEEAAGLAPEQVVALSEELSAAKQQIEWFKRQLFGQKSERRVLDPHSEQLALGESFDQSTAQAEAPRRRVAALARSLPRARSQESEESLPFFDEARVPVERIELVPEEIAGLQAEDYEIIGYKDSYRLAQRPGSYVVLHYRRAVVKLRERVTISPLCATTTTGPATRPSRWTASS